MKRNCGLYSRGPMGTTYVADGKFKKKQGDKLNPHLEKYENTKTKHRARQRQTSGTKKPMDDEEGEEKGHGWFNMILP